MAGRCLSFTSRVQGVFVAASLVLLAACERMEPPTLHADGGGAFRACGRSGTAEACGDALQDRWRGRPQTLRVKLARGVLGADLVQAVQVAGRSGFLEVSLHDAGGAGLGQSRLAIPMFSEPEWADWRLLSGEWGGEALSFRASPVTARRADGSEVRFEWIQVGAAVEWRDQRLAVESAAQALHLGPDTCVILTVTPAASAGDVVTLISDLGLAPQRLVLLAPP